MTMIVCFCFVLFCFALLCFALLWTSLIICLLTLFSPIPVIKCSPDFPGSRNCLKHLNQTGDLTKFICMMRLGFRQIVTKP